jgi:hypothetical protein
MIRQSQSGMEFLIIAGAVMFFFTIFFVAVQTSTSEREKEKEVLLSNNLALSVQDEISLAAESSDGYTRRFTVPEKMLGGDYEISLVEGRVYIKTDTNAISLKIENITGEIKKGENIIKNEKGRVYLNQ